MQTKRSNLPPGDDAQLIALLEQIQPHPSRRFYRRMAEAPWQPKAGAGARVARLWPRRGSLRLAAATIALLLIVSAATLAAPSLRAAARQWMLFFLPNPTASMQLQVTAPALGDSNVFEAPGYFALSMAEAEEQAGFPAGEISLPELAGMLPGLEFTGAHYDPQMQLLVARYSVDGRSLYISRRLLGQVQEYSSIGPAALVEKVTVHGVEGEYVAGGWVATQRQPATLQPGETQNLEVTWDPVLPQRILRWQKGDSLYEIVASAALGREFEIGQEAMILIAEAVK